MKSILFVFTLLSVSCLQAQKNLTTHFGIKGGFNISSLKVDEGEDFDSKIGFHIGGLAHVHLSPHFAVQPELVYSAQGGSDNDFKIKLGYITLPVLLQYMTGNGFRIETGPQLGFLTSGKSKQNDVEINIKDQLNTVDLAWAFGVGYLTSSSWGADARLNLGIANVNEDDEPKIRNMVFQLGVFYQFMHKK